MYLIQTLLILINLPFIIFRIGFWQINVVAIIIVLLLWIDIVADYKISDMFKRFIKKLKEMK